MNPPQQSISLGCWTLVLVRGFNDRNRISNSLPEGICAEKVPNASLYELLLRLFLKMRDEQVDSSRLFDSET